MAGNSLTVGGFFNYFVVQFHPSSFLMAAAMIAPETSQSFSVIGRWVALRSRNRKLNWIVFLIAARLAGMMLPLALLWPVGSGMSQEPIFFILSVTFAWYLLQGIAYVNYISWLSDLVPEVHWGKLLSRRQLAGLVVSLGMPLATVWLRQHLLKGLPLDAERWSYSVLFIVGGVLTLSSILPLMSFEEVPWQSVDRQTVTGNVPFRVSRSFCFLLASRWWLAFFQGLTQAVFFKYAVDQLQISLPTYTLLTSMMILSQMPMAYWAGHLCDRFQEKRGLIGSMLWLSFALPLWIFATSDTWYLLCIAYLIWGGFGMLNVCGQSLCLKLAPPSDNAGHFALFDQVSGLIAGLAGLLGGFWLDRLLRDPSNDFGANLSPFAVLFVVSWFGRLTAPLWLIGVGRRTAG
ncbi:MFS transporter [Planctomicrobium sp. SH661]|uniref:MFS transporter n=1 Tax=Planctomicrobium sp. SH661 TaxID=3448124 RepID=UPI003F5AF774